MERTSRQRRVDSNLSIIKQWYQENYPICPFCGHRVFSGDLAHFIRRSDRSKYWNNEDLQTLVYNVGLAHRDCHDIYDNHPDQAHYLPKILDVAFNVFIIAPDLYPSFADLYKITQRSFLGNSATHKAFLLLNSRLHSGGHTPLVREADFCKHAYPFLPTLLAIQRSTIGRRKPPTFPSVVQYGLIHDVSIFDAS